MSNQPTQRSIMISNPLFCEELQQRYWPAAMALKSKQIHFALAITSEHQRSCADFELVNHELMEIKL
jgi:hypothetical protein